jgi:thioredoxin reductase (NADPH)
MTTNTTATSQSTPQLPVLFIVDANRGDRRAIEDALIHRFGADYRVLSTGSAEVALDVLAELARAERSVAIIAADVALPGSGGIAFLEKAQALHRGAARALLVSMDEHGTRIPINSLASLQRAIALGRIDFSLLKNWVAPDEWLYPQIQEALSRWTKANRPHHETVKVVGEQWSPASHELRDALGRNTVPFGFYSTETEAGQHLVHAHNIDVARLPAVILHDGTILHQPTLVQMADALGNSTRPGKEVYDLVILGGGPAGLSAAVYAASEGLRTLVVEACSIGGQAGTSSMIRNYLGFPRGVSGEDLTFRAYEQALMFGTKFIFMRRATALETRGDQHIITLSDGSTVTTRAVIIATGVEYRRLDIPALVRLIGAGVFYGAAGVEAPAMAGESVCVIGGANSAGQAALHLAKFAARVALLVRGPSLDSMSEYLITELHSTTNIEIRLNTRVVDGQGEYRLDGLVLENTKCGEREVVPAAAVFVLIGAESRTEWLGDQLQRDSHGFILTGHDTTSENAIQSRQPQPFETTIPGVFAVGDVRHGSVKRVAGAVGDGSVAVSAVHQYLAATASSSRSVPRAEFDSSSSRLLPL